MYKGGMRFLFVPTIGMPHNVMKDGTYVFARRVVQDLLDAGHYVYMVLPEECKHTLKDDHPRVMYVYSNLPVLVYDVMNAIVDTTLLAELFSPKIGKYMIDAVVTWSPEHALQLTSALSAHTHFGRVPVFFIEQGVDWFDSNPMYTDDKLTESLKCIGGVYSRPIFLCPRDKKMWLAKSKYYGLSPSQIAAIDKNSAVCGVPVDLAKIEKYRQGFEKRKEFTCLFAARTNATKHPEKIMEVFDSLYKSGEPVGVKYLTLTSDMGCVAYVQKWKIFEGRSYCKPVYSASVDQFYEEAAQSHLYMSMSDSEAFPVAIMEATLLNLVVLVVDADWSRSLFQGVLPEQFFVKEGQDAVEKARWVVHHRDEALAMMGPMRQFFLSLLKDHRIADHVESVTRQLVSDGVKTKFYAYSGFKQLLDEIGEFFAKDAPQSFHELLQLMATKSRNWKPDNAVRASTRRFPSNFDLHGLMRVAYGLNDKCDRAFPVYERGEP